MPLRCHGLHRQEIEANKHERRDFLAKLSQLAGSRQGEREAPRSLGDATLFLSHQFGAAQKQISSLLAEKVTDLWTFSFVRFA